MAASITEGAVPTGGAARCDPMAPGRIHRSPQLVTVALVCLVALVLLGATVTGPDHAR